MEQLGVLTRGGKVDPTERHKSSCRNQLASGCQIKVFWNQGIERRSGKKNREKTLVVMTSCFEITDHHRTIINFVGVTHSQASKNIPSWFLTRRGSLRNLPLCFLLFARFQMFRNWLLLASLTESHSFISFTWTDRRFPGETQSTNTGFRPNVSSIA